MNVYRLSARETLAPRWRIKRVPSSRYLRRNHHPNRFLVQKRITFLWWSFWLTVDQALCARHAHAEVLKLQGKAPAPLPTQIVWMEGDTPPKDE